MEFKKKEKIVFVLDVAKGKALKINIGFAEIGGHPFVFYISKNQIPLFVGTVNMP